MVYGRIERKIRVSKEEKRKEFISWIKTIVFAVTVAFLVNNFIVVNAQIPSGSMENTIMTGDRLWANRLAYISEEPQRGDIIVFKFPDNEKELYVKRIIGVPGDKIEIYGGAVYINGEKLEEDYLKEAMDKDGVWGVYEVPDGAYFVLGDNRNVSIDARYWQNTYVYKKNILGKAILKYYPKIEWIADK